nr:hypothetical protein [Tanacetum cinerariifolium]
MWLVDDFGAWNTYPWGEYTWEKFSKMTVNVVATHIAHHLAEIKKNLNFNVTYNLYEFAWAFKLSNPNVALISSLEEIRNGWFMASIEFIKGLADQDGNIFEDDLGGGNVFQSDEAGVEAGDDVLDSGGDGIHLSKKFDTDQQAGTVSPMASTSPQARNVSIAKFFAKFDAHKNQVALIKKRKADEFNDLANRFSKLKSSQTFLMFKRILQNDVCIEKEETNFNPKQSEEIPNFFSSYKDTSNLIASMSTDPMINKKRTKLDQNRTKTGSVAKPREVKNFLMTSFGYRLNPRYVIKECSSCGTLYTRNCSCSKGNVEYKILVLKLPESCARCAKCRHPVNGPYCQGCALLREKLEEDLVTYFQNFQNISESSDDNTNVVNAPREPFVVKQDHGVNPRHIDKCCCECGNALDGIFCQQCICKSCGKGAHTCYNCPPKVSIISNPEPCNQTMNNELPQTLPSFDPTCYSNKENSVPCVSKPNFVDESSNIFNPPPQPPIYYYEFYESNA